MQDNGRGSDLKHCMPSLKANQVCRSAQRESYVGLLFFDGSAIVLVQREVGKDAEGSLANIIELVQTNQIYIIDIKRHKMVFDVTAEANI